MERVEVRKLPAAEVCRRYGISRWTLRRWHESQAVAFPKPIIVNSRRYFDEAEISTWESQRSAALTAVE